MSAPEPLSIRHRPLTTGFSMALLLSFCGAAALCYGWKQGQTTRGLAWKSESNYITAIGRIEAARRAGRRPLLFLGSSHTGRIPGAESAANLPWNAVGLDSSSAAEGAELLLAGKLPPADVVVIEAETFFNDRPFVTEKGQRQDNLPFFMQAGYRSGSLLFTELRQQRTGQPQAEPATPQAPSEAKPENWTGGDEARLQRLLLLQEKLHCRVLPILLPCRSGHTEPALREKTAHMAARLHTPYLDLNELRCIRFTDHTHMDSPSALRAAWSVYRFIETERALRP